jgi:DnaJ-class molecular chaperone
MADCEICGGRGQYGIVDIHGKYRYAIRCPECDGSGEEEPEDEPDDEREDRERHEERCAAAWAIIQQNARSVSA